MVNFIGEKRGMISTFVSKYNWRINSMLFVLLCSFFNAFSAEKELGKVEVSQGQSKWVRGEVSKKTEKRPWVKGVPKRKWVKGVVTKTTEMAPSVKNSFNYLKLEPTITKEEMQNKVGLLLEEYDPKKFDPEKRYSLHNRTLTEESVNAAYEIIKKARDLLNGYFESKEGKEEREIKFGEQVVKFKVPKQ